MLARGLSFLRSIFPHIAGFPGFRPRWSTLDLLCPAQGIDLALVDCGSHFCIVVGGSGFQS